jgi:hypothetical protein
MAQDVTQLVAAARGFLATMAYSAEERPVFAAIVDEIEKAHAKPMLSHTRVSELLDYASVYGEFSETTPLGTMSTHGTVLGRGQHHAIIAYKKVLCLLPIDWPVNSEQLETEGHE